jgi:hypothetical protein
MVRVRVRVRVRHWPLDHARTDHARDDPVAAHLGLAVLIERRLQLHGRFGTQRDHGGLVRVGVRG